MKYRKLRITWSVGCGIACVMLIVLWIRAGISKKNGSRRVRKVRRGIEAAVC